MFWRHFYIMLKKGAFYNLCPLAKTFCLQRKCAMFAKKYKLCNQKKGRKSTTHFLGLLAATSFLTQKSHKL